MAKRTVETGVFGALGVEDPVSFTAHRTLGRVIDFAKVNLAENKTFPILPIPKGMCITTIAVEQLIATDQDVTVTFGLASDSTKAVGGNFALKDLSATSEELLRSCQDAASSTNSGLFVNEADMLCLIVPDALTGDKLAKGKIAVYIDGFETFGEGFESVPSDTEAWRTKLQTQDNVSGGQIDKREFEG